ARRVVPPREDAVVVAVLAKALPGDDELARLVDRDDRGLLVAGRVGVHLELRPELVARGVEALSEDAVAVTVLPPARPDHDELAGGCHCHGLSDRVLEAGRVRVDEELGTDRAATAETLAVDLRVRRVELTVARPHHDEIPSAVPGHPRVVLFARRG